MTPPNYESFEEKSEVFKENFKIDNEEEVDSIVSMYSSHEKDFCIVVLIPLHINYIVLLRFSGCYLMQLVKKRT